MCEILALMGKIKTKDYFTVMRLVHNDLKQNAKANFFDTVHVLDPEVICSN